MVSDREPLAEPEAVPVATSRIVITFAGPGLADHTVTLDHVDAGQVYAAAFLLDCIGREARSGSLIRDAVAPGGLGPGLDLGAILGNLRG